MLLAGTDKKSLMPSPKLLANPMGLPITPADPNTYKTANSKEQEKTVNFECWITVASII